MQTYKRFVVMYENNVPAELVDYVGQDKALNITKTGLQNDSGVRAFRCLVTTEWHNSFDDQSRILVLTQLFETLRLSNKILAWRKLN